MKNKKTMIAIISVIAVILVLIGVTYAYWLVTKEQVGENVISSACLDISINGSNDINLPNSFPMSDEDGMTTTPYTFTVTNNCNTSIDYQINLETLSAEDDTIIPSAIKVALNDEISLLSNKAETSVTIENANTARILGFSRLAASGNEGSTDTYELRLWIDADASISEQNKTFTSKITASVGQNISNQFEEGTLAYDIVSQYGGTTSASEINVEEWLEDKSSTSHYNTILKENLYYYGTKYELDQETGKFKLSGELVQSTVDDCRSGAKECGKYTLRNTDINYSSGVVYEITSFTNNDNPDTETYAAVTQKTIYSKQGFNQIPADGEASLHKAQDDYGTSYYFRGDVENNYVQFGIHSANGPVVDYGNPSSNADYETMDECIRNAWDDPNDCVYLYKANDPMYWRIIRINGDETIRLIYDGTEKIKNGIDNPTAKISNSVFNTSYNVGFTYDNGSGIQADSAIKIVLDNWYNANIKDKYDKHIADSVFCNDRDMLNVGYFDSRIYRKTPTLQCKNKVDRYTVEDTITGNGYLSNPVGLITADELLMVSLSTNGYLYSTNDYNDYYWTATPADDSSIYVAYFGSPSPETTSTNEFAVRPVINLKADVKFTGNGSFETPYEIVME